MKEKSPRAYRERLGFWRTVGKTVFAEDEEEVAVDEDAMDGVAVVAGAGFRDDEEEDGTIGAVMIVPGMP